MSDHALIISIGTGGYLSGEIRCNASPEAECRSKPDCMCEELSNIVRDEQGWFHTYGTWDDEDNERIDIHRHHPSDECNICNWLNAEDPMECYAGKGYFSLPGVPIEPIWAGGFYEWKPAASGPAD